jgi:hypothetical protein
LDYRGKLIVNASYVSVKENLRHDELRFGPVPTWAQQRLNAASEEQLTQWLGSVLTEKEKLVLKLAGKITAQQIADAETKDLPPPWRLACQMVVRDEDILVKF